MPRPSEAAPAFLGRDTERSIFTFGVALALSLGVYLLGVVAGRRGLMDAVAGQMHFVVLFVLVVGGAVAAGNAYRNDGLVLSWLLVFGPVLGWLWHVFVQGPVSFERVVEPLLWAGLAAAFVGTVGYAVGRRLRAPRDGADEFSDQLLRILVGDDSSQPVTWGIGASGLFLVSAASVSVTRPYFPLPVEGVSLLELFLVGGVFAVSTLLGAIVLLGWLGLAAWPASRTEGLFVSWGLIFGPMFGAFLTDFVLDGISGSGPPTDATLAFLAALVFALVLGTGGFVLGRGLRLVVEHRRVPDRRSLGS